MSSPRSTPSPHSVLPPIISKEKDRDFLIGLNCYIDRELSKVDSTNPEQRYTVYKAAFDRIVDYVTAYKPLLTAVKAEYEDCVDTIKRGQREAFFLAGKLKAMANEPSTIRNYRKRADELEQKMAVIETDNERLSKQVNALRAARIAKQQKMREVSEPVPQKKEPKHDQRPIPGLTLAQSTDLKVLTRELEKLEQQLKDLSLSHRTRYSPKEHRDVLKEQLTRKVELRDHLHDQTQLMKLKRHKLKIAVEAAQAYIKIQPPHQTIGDAVVMSLARSSNQFVDKGPGEDGILHGTPSTTFEDDDPNREKEAEMMLEYIEKFNELLDDRKYEEAAIHAANSPKGILRTPETLHRFKELRHLLNTSGRSPLLAFCDALMSTVLAYAVRPSEYMSQECVQCALEENRLDLLSHWISQDRLTVTERLGHMIYNYCKSKPQCTRSCLALAQRIYEEVEAHAPVLICMVRQGRVNQALDYARRNKLRHIELAQVLRRCPGPQLAQGLYETRTTTGHSLLPLGAVVWTLLQTDVYDIGLHLIQDIQDHGPKEDSGQLQDRTPLRDAVFADNLTTEEQWVDIVQKCQENGYHDISIDILAAVTVLNSVRNAAKYMDDMEKKREEEEREKQREEEKKKKEREKKEKKRRRRRPRETTDPGQEKAQVMDHRDGNETDDEHSEENY